MKNILIGLLVLGSFSTYAAELRCDFDGNDYLPLKSGAIVKYETNKKGKILGNILPSGALEPKFTWVAPGADVKNFKVSDIKTITSINWDKNSESPTFRTTIYSSNKDAERAITIRVNQFSKVGEIVDAVAILNSPGGVFILDQGKCEVISL